MVLVHLSARNGDLTSSATTVALLVALVVLVLVALLAICTLFVLRRLRKSRSELGLPLHDAQRELQNSQRNHRRLTLNTGIGRESVCVTQEKHNLIENSHSPPESPVPEIRITFPEEMDNNGRRASGRVVVVRIGEQSIGLEPLQEDLPPYQKDPSDRFDSLDLERIGGLKEARTPTRSMGQS